MNVTEYKQIFAKGWNIIEMTLLQINQDYYWRFKYKTQKILKLYGSNTQSEIIYKGIKNANQQGLGLVDPESTKGGGSTKVCK